MEANPMAQRNYSVTRVAFEDAHSMAAMEAERRLFEHYSLDVKVHSVPVPGYGIRVRVFDIGSGEPTFVVPGGSGEAAPFVPFIAHLKGRRIIAINRPGGGLSDYIDVRQVDFRRFAVEVLSSVLDTLGLESVPVVANSMGGLWSFWLALDQPERVDRLAQL